MELSRSNQNYSIQIWKATKRNTTMENVKLSLVCLYADKGMRLFTLGLPYRALYSRMVALLYLKNTYWVSLFFYDFILLKYRFQRHYTIPILMLLWFEAYCGMISEPFQLSVSLAFCWEAMAKWWNVTVFDLWHIYIFLLTHMIEAVVCDYKFLLGLLTVQEETNPLWSNNFLPRFGITANTCIEVPHDHQVVRW